MVKTRGNIDAHAEKFSSDLVANGRDTEDMPRSKKSKKRAKHDKEIQLTETDSTNNRERKKLRKSKRQKEKRQQEQSDHPRRSHRNSSRNSVSGSEEEKEPNKEEEEEMQTNEDFKMARNNSQSEEEKRSNSKNSNNKSHSLGVQADESMEEVESVVKSDEENVNRNYVSKTKKTSNEKKKLKKLLRLKRKQKLLKSKMANQPTSRKLRSSTRNSEGNSDGNSSKKEQTSENDQADMYTIVKRDRKRVGKNMHGMPVLDREVSRESKKKADDFIKEDDDDDDDEDDGQNAEGDDEEEEEEMTEVSYDSNSMISGMEGSSILVKSYNLRKHATGSYTESSKRKSSRRMERNRESDSSFSDDDESSYEKLKERNKMKRFLPINMRDGHSNGAGDSMSLIDGSVNFNSIGGLDKHIMSLKEMVVFPFLYSEFFRRFKIRAPKGVLFYGPPGTGKTLVARALANECSQGHKKVAFFLRKGSDCLSKWVGESEKHLRILFEQAHQMKPSIIFFDEIDGLIPMRSGKQDQVHNSIVSTLLALMDGLEDEGEVMIIGSTNRIDSIDPAFRRPGRFDRELLFPLPTKEGRVQILTICTREWVPRLTKSTIQHLASNTDGYSGADLKYLCTEAALIALKRRYPQIFSSKDKLAINVQDIRITVQDFALAMQQIVPSANRLFAPVAKALPHLVRPLLKVKLRLTFDMLNDIFPSQPLQAMLNLNVKEDSPENIEEGGASNNEQPFSLGSFPSLPPIYRPRFLISGASSHGHTSYLCPAILHQYEGLPVHVVDLASTFSGEVNSSADTLCQILQQFKNCIPSILYLPNINMWWSKVDEVTSSILVTTLDGIDPTMPLLVLASSSVPYEEVPQEIKSAFQNFYEMKGVGPVERRNFFHEVVVKRPCMKPIRNRKKVRETIPVVPAPVQRPPEGVELEKVRKAEDGILRSWRTYLRSIVSELLDSDESIDFKSPVKEAEVPDYYDLILAPMDLSTMRTKISLNRYKNMQEFLEDIDLIHNNALEYNSIKNSKGLKIRRHARVFKDLAYLIVDESPDVELERQCMNVHKERLARGEETEEFEKEEFDATIKRRKWTRDVKKSEESSAVEGQMTGTSTQSRRSRPKSKASRSLEEEFDMLMQRRKQGRKRSQAIYSSDDDDDDYEDEPPAKKSKSSRIESTSTTSSYMVLQSDPRSSNSLLATNFGCFINETPKTTESKTEEENLPAEEAVVFEEKEEELEEELGEPEEPSLVVSVERLEEILDVLVERSEGFTVDDLVKVHSTISKEIFKHKDDFDKTALIEDLDFLVSKL